MLLDTSALIEISQHRKDSALFERIKGLISDEELFVSIIQLAEVADWCFRNNLSVNDGLSAIKEIVQVVPLDEFICKEGAALKRKQRSKAIPDFGLIDGIILATARSIAQKLLTFDPHFSRENDCIVLKR